MTAIETEIGMTLGEYRAMTRDEQKAKSKTLTQDQINAFNRAFREDIDAAMWKQRVDGTCPRDVEDRIELLERIAQTPIAEKFNAETFGMMFEDYITTYPVNVNMFNQTSTLSIGAYGGILNFELLERAIDEIMEVGFDKFGFMLEWLQTWDYLTPTHAMITSTMRRKMPEYNSKA